MPIPLPTLDTSQGAPLLTGSGALILRPRLLPIPAVLPPPDPTTGKFVPPRGLVTRSGIALRAASGMALLRGFLPLPAVQLLITGVTRDSTGAALGGCVVALYLTSTGVLVDKVTSDGGGNYTFTTAGLSEAYFVVAYLAGSPDVSGTTVNTLTGS